MRILVDTSVWSLALRRKNRQPSEAVNLLKKYINDGEFICIIGIILQEILSGITNQKLFEQLADYIVAFPLIQLTREDYIKAAELRNNLRRFGVQIGTIDALIASTCIRNDLLLLSTDKDFRHIAKHTNLQLIKVAD